MRYDSLVPKKSNTTKRTSKLNSLPATNADGDQPDLFPLDFELPSGGVEMPPPDAELLPPDAEEFKILCELARYIQQHTPWDFMEEKDVFGVQDPDTGDLGFISVMGALGEYTAIAVYRGVEALYAWREFEDLLEADPESHEAHNILMEIPQLHVSFDPARFLEKRDRKLIKHSGVKFPKEKPLFRCYRPGYYPWFLTRPEARYLIHALTQTIEVAKQFLHDDDVIPLNEDPEDRDYLIRVPRIDGDVVTWKSFIRAIDQPPTQLIPIDVEAADLEKLKVIPKSDPQEIDLFILPAKVGEPNERPQVLYALMVVDAASGFILGIEALAAPDGPDLMYAELAHKVAEMWLKHEVIPTELRSRSTRVLNMFQSLAGELEFQLLLVKELPAIDEAKRFMFEEMNLQR
jgi:hypothetical protein